MHSLSHNDPGGCLWDFGPISARAGFASVIDEIVADGDADREAGRLLVAWNFLKGGQRFSDKLPRRSFPLLCPVECFFSGPIQHITHCGDEFVVIERLHEKCDWADGHGGGARGQIFTGSDDDHLCAG
jgi:hypothetical protein